MRESDEFKELNGKVRDGSATPEEHARWQELKQRYLKASEAAHGDRRQFQRVPMALEVSFQSRDELVRNLPRYQTDYERGLDEYFAGRLNIDNLLDRREKLQRQEQEIGHLTFLVAANVAELCAATGKFFELLNGDPDGERLPRPGP